MDFLSSVFPELKHLTPEQVRAYTIYIQIACVVFGFLAGAFIMWMVSRSKMASLRVEKEEMSRAAEKANADFEAKIANHEKEITELRNAEIISLKRQGELEASLAAEQGGLKEQQQLITEMEARFSQNFRDLSNDSLRECQEKFMSLAQEALVAQQVEVTKTIEQRKSEIEQVQSRVEELEKNLHSEPRLATPLPSISAAVASTLPTATPIPAFHPEKNPFEEIDGIEENFEGFTEDDDDNGSFAEDEINTSEVVEDKANAAAKDLRAALSNQPAE